MAELSERMWDMSDFFINTIGGAEHLSEALTDRNHDHDVIRSSIRSRSAEVARVAMQSHIVETVGSSAMTSTTPPERRTGGQPTATRRPRHRPGQDDGDPEQLHPGPGRAHLRRPAQPTGLSKATLHRLLGDLLGARLLDRVDGRYRLSKLVFELGMRASVERSLLEVALPFLEDLYERTHEIVHLGVREGDEVALHRQGRRTPAGEVSLADRWPNAAARDRDRQGPARPCPRQRA